jgi:hypothetical protein
VAPGVRWFLKRTPDIVPVTLRAKPVGREPVLPTNPSTLSDQALMELFSRYVVYLQYSKVQHARAASRAADLRRRERIIRARVYLTSTGNREERAAKEELNSEVIELGQKASVAEAEAAIYYAIFDGYNEAKALLSRELTRRVDLERGRGQG